MIPFSEVFKKINLFHEPGLREEILEHCELQTFEKSEVIVREGQFVKVIPIVVTGKTQGLSNQGGQGNIALSC